MHCTLSSLSRSLAMFTASRSAETSGAGGLTWVSISADLQQKGWQYDQQSHLHENLPPRLNVQAAINSCLIMRYAVMKGLLCGGSSYKETVPECLPANGSSQHLHTCSAQSHDRLRPHRRASECCGGTDCSIIHLHSFTCISDVGKGLAAKRQFTGACPKNKRDAMRVVGLKQGESRMKNGDHADGAQDSRAGCPGRTCQELQSPERQYFVWGANAAPRRCQKPS